MVNLSAKIRKDFGKKVEKGRKKGVVPAILYGPKLENASLDVDLKEFEKVYQEAGGSSLVELQVDKKKFLVLIHAVEIDAISQKPIHVDFYQPKLDEEIEATVPLVFQGEAPAVKDLGGTLVKSIHELEVKALPQNLPHEIKVDISMLKTFEDSVSVKDLVVPQEVKILKEPDETVVFVAEPEKIEEELEKPVEEKVEEVEKVEEKKEEEGGEEAAQEKEK
jgi:large subunit ribosomal protein L25